MIINTYKPQLDGVRAAAAVAVLCNHLMPPHSVLNFEIWGYPAVRLFFVLSGFLITGILLDLREEATGRTTLGSLAIFYARRSLRILPVYYLLVGLFATFVSFWSSEMLAYSTYTTNWFLIMNGTPANGGPDLLAGHFWSLAVEEQYYLVWPWLILLVPTRLIFWAIAAVIAIGPASRCLMALSGCSAASVGFNTFGCLDSLGAGSLLAYVRRDHGSRAAGQLVRLGLIVAALLFVVAPPVPSWWRTHYVLWFTFRDIVLIGPYLWLVWAAVEEKTGALGWLLGAAPVIYVGKLSYGLYLYHIPIKQFGPALLARLGVGLPEPGYWQSLLLMVISLGVASLSWHLFELPVNSLKRYFPYARRGSDASEVGLSA